MVKEQLLIIKTSALREVKRLEKVLDTVCDFQIIYSMFCKIYFYKKQWLYCFGLVFMFDLAISFIC